MARDERGYLLVLAALAVTCVLGVAAIAIDVGCGYLLRLKVQDAVDAAALAGAAELPSDAAGAEAVARDYAACHGLEDSAVRVRVLTASEAGGGGARPDEALSVVRVRASRSAPAAFGRVLGVELVRVEAEAEARVAPLGAARGVVPLGIADQDYVVGERYVLKLAGGEGERGNFHALAAEGRGAGDWSYALAHGLEGLVRVGDMVATEPGNMSGPTREALRYRLSSARPGETFGDFAPDSPRLLLVPVVDFSGVHGRDRVPVLGFAYFYLEDVVGSGRTSEIVGRFLRRAGPGEPGTWEGYRDWQALCVRLSR